MSDNNINEISKKTLGNYIATASRRIESDTEKESGRKAKASRAINSVAQAEIDSWETGQHAKNKNKTEFSPEHGMRNARHELERADVDLQNKHSDKMYRRHGGIRTALKKLGAGSKLAKVMAREETEMTIDENEAENQEIELTPAQAIIQAALDKDHVGIADAFDAAVRAKIDAAMFGGDDEQDDVVDEPTDAQESVETIDELSTSTLKSYMKKSVDSARHHSDKADAYSDKALDMKTHRGAERWFDKAAPHEKKFHQRLRGQVRAKTRIAYAKGK